MAPSRNAGLGQLPPDLIIKVINYLPVPHLAKTARLNRLFKAVTYSDAIYEPRLQYLGLNAEGKPLSRTAGRTNAAGGPRNASSAAQGANGAPPRPGSASAKHAPATRPPSKADKAPSKARDGRPPSALGERGKGGGGKSPALLDDGPGDLLGGGDTGKLPPALMDFPSLFQGNRRTQRFDPGSGKPRLVFKEEFLKCARHFRPFRGDRGLVKLEEDFPVLADRAAMLGKLNKFGNAKLLEDTAVASARVAAAMQDLSNLLIASFAEAYDASDYVRMKEISQASYMLDGGAACVQLFLSKNPVLFDPTFNPSLIATNIPAAADSDDFVLADSFATFMEQLLANVKSQIDIIADVFPPETRAITIYIQAVFQASVSDYLAAVLQQAKATDTIGYLNTLVTAVAYCTQFVDVIDEQLGGKAQWQKEDVLALVKGTFDVYYATYIDVELQALRERYQRDLSRWEAERKAKAKPPAASTILTGDVETFRSSVLSSMKNVLLAPSYLTRTLMQPFRTVEQSEKSPHSPHIETLKLDEHLTDLVSLELSLSMMHLNKDGVKRANALAGVFNKSDARGFVQSIFVVLLRYLGTRHMTTAFDEAIRRLARTRPADDVNSLVVESLSQFFELVHVADMIQQMVHIYYTDEILRYVDESDFLSEVVVEKKQFEHVLDDQVASGMDSAIQVLMQHIEYILRTEQVVPEDYNPHPNVPLDLTPTKACGKVVAILYAHTRMIRGTTDKHILDVFFQEVGIRFHAIIIKHLKKQQISTVGGLRVICDLTEYYNWAITLRNPEVTKMFAVLKEIGNLYIVESAADLKEMVHDTDRYHNQVRVEEIYELLQGRADWKKIQKDVEVSDCSLM
ncbi:exocyst complex component Sec10-domain-containing protein [Hyaloraphidium curvatum]|nr:exocyst complex component Sec10-domain-containing protein [Hyaloraphidium curvatum]